MRRIIGERLSRKTPSDATQVMHRRPVISCADLPESVHAEIGDVAASDPPIVVGFDHHRGGQP